MADEQTHQLIEVQPEHAFTLASIWLSIPSESEAVELIESRDMYHGARGMLLFRYGKHSLCVFFPLTVSRSAVVARVHDYMRANYDE